MRGSVDVRSDWSGGRDGVSIDARGGGRGGEGRRRRHAHEWIAPWIAKPAALSVEE